MARVNIVIVGGPELLRRGLWSLLEVQPGWEVAGEAIDGLEAVAKAKQFKPDVVILVVDRPTSRASETTRQILRAVPGTRVLILVMHESEHVVRELLTAGAHGYALQSDAGRDLLAAVEALHRNKTFLTASVSKIVLHDYVKPSIIARPDISARCRLSPREQEIIHLLLESKSSKEIATALGIAVKTTECHRANIMRKLRFHSVVDLVRYAIRNNMVEP